MRIRFGFFLVSFVTGAWADAQTQGSPPQQVVINGSQTDVEAGRDFVAGKIIIGKQRIAESGLQNAGELLRREPAISIGKDGRIGLLGMASYTQILVDGMPSQVDPLAIDLVQIDRIEIIKSTTAATGPIGIAGTINIIRRKTERQAYSQLRFGGSSTGGRLGEDLSWSSNQLVSGSPFSYNMSFSASHKPTPGQSHYVVHRLAGTTPRLEYEGDVTSPSEINTLLASSEFSWALNKDQKISLSPNVGRVGYSQNSQEQRRWSDGSKLFVQQHNDQPLTNYELPLRWNWQIDTDSSLALNLRTSRGRLDLGAVRSEDSPDAFFHRYKRGQTRDIGSHFLTLDFNTDFSGGHEITAGAKILRNDVNTNYANFTDDVPDFSEAVFGTDSATRVDSKQLFAQDEWRMDKSLTVNMGASVETRVYEFNEGPVRNQAHFNMWSPSMHVSKKINGNKKRQVRASLARSFQAPATDQMLLHPSINPFVPCQKNQPCSGNSIDTADSAGNPNLQPERALGLNLSYAHGIGADSELLVEFYSRDVQNKIGRELTLESVAWASVPRYLSRPANLGQAKVRGVNFEGRLSGKDIWRNSPSMELHGSVGYAHSELSALPGPDNRIAEQTPWRAKLGGSYSLQSTPLKLGFEASLLPAEWVRSNLSERVYQSSKRTVGANAIWKLSPSTKLSLNIDNLVPRNSARIDEYQNREEIVQRITDSSNYTRIGVRIETRL